MSTAESTTPLAIIGIGCLFPGADNLGAYWARIRNGVDAITDVPPTHWRPEDYYHPDPKAPDRIYTARGGFLHATPFNPAAFGIAPNSLEATDTAQLLGLVVAQQALADAGYNEERSFDRGRVSVILGVTGTLELVVPLGARLGHPIWRRALREAGVTDDIADDVVRRIGDSYVGWQENSFPGLLGNVVAGRIANRFDLGGTNCVVDAACASSLSALHLACLELTAGRADMVLTGGVDTFNDIFMYMCFSKTPALSPTGDARPFDASADGTILGEGVGMVVLKRLDDARRDGDRVYAILRGLGSSSDGRGNAIYAPRAAGQVEALRKAYRVAGVTPDTIDMIEAHGTGTRVGDAAEVTALTEVYRPASGVASAPRETQPWCALGSVKSQIGHTKAAAGVAGLIKAVSALHHKVLPPTIKVKEPIEPLRSGDSPFYINTEARPWMPSPDHPRRAAVSAFGFGGSNFHCVLEEANPHKEAVDWDGDTQILAFMGSTPADIEQQLSRWPANLEWPGFRARAAQTRQTWDAAAACRLLLVVQRERTDLPRLIENARSLLRSQGQKAAFRGPEGIFFGRDSRAGKLAVLFPGQGAQYPGMLRELACQFPALHDTLVQAYQPEAPARDFSDRIYPLVSFTAEDRRVNEEALRATDIAQPALGAVSLGAWRILEQFGVRADAAAGHSYGELTALCAAGRLKPAAFFHLSRLRGRLMAAAGADGAMLAVQATREVITETLRADNLDLVLANKNAPQQTVLSGPTATIERAAVAFASRQIRAQRLSVSAAFHSPLVAAAAEPFRAALEEIAFHPAAMPVFANSTAEAYPDDAAAARDLLAGQLAHPVEFVRMVERLHESGARTFLEVGPGPRLTGLVSAILQDRDHEALALDSSNGQRSSVYDLACCLAALAARGHEIHLAAWDADAPRPQPAADSSKRTLWVPICGANYVKPKPKRADKPMTPAKGEAKAVAGAPSSSASRPIMNRTPNPTMNGSTTPSEVTPAVVDGNALGQALHLTRDSLAALQRMQDQTAQLHRQFLDGQDAAQLTVQFLVEQQQRLLQNSLGLPAGPAPLLTPLPAPVANQPVGWAESSRPTTPPLVGLEDSAHPTTTTTTTAPQPAPPIPATRSVEDVRSHSERGNERNARIKLILLEVVAEKTGYPTEMLELDMSLDADLGIDSIKRVEILSALQERLPEAPAIKPEHLGTLHNLRQIAAFLADSDAAAPIVGQAASLSTTEEDKLAACPTGLGEEQVRTVLLEVVAEKTGYPTEMLELDMSLDADLGIDSIKRVEILSALQERLPEAPAIKPEHLGTLHNLRQIVAFLAGSSNGHVEKPAAAPPLEKEKEKVSGTFSNPIERSILRAVPLANASSRQSIRLQAGAEIWIASEEDALSSALNQRLLALGYRPRRVAVAALRDLERPVALDALMIVANRMPADEAFLKNALFGLQHGGPALRAAGRRGGALFVTVSRLDGAFGLGELDAGRDPVDGGLAGLAKTAGQEWPEVHCKAIDLADDFASSEETADAIVEEMFRAGPVEVGLARDERRTLERVVQPLAVGTERSFQPGDAIVLSGGARGVTAEVAVALARAFQPTLILLGRTPEPSAEPDWLAPLTTEAEIKRELGSRANGNVSLKLIGEQYRLVSAQREIRQTLARIEAAGARAIYRAVDIRDAAAVAAVLTSLCQQLDAPVRGIVHGAGVLADARIEDKTPEQFECVYKTKVAGLQTLLRAVEPDELRALVLFSSSTGRFGRVGQVDYAIANEVLNKLAQQQARRLPNCRVVSVNWGPWDGGMVTPALKQVFAQEGIGLIPLEAGANSLVEELRSPPGGAVEVVVLDSGAATVRERAFPSLPHGRGSDLPHAFERILERAAHPVLESHILDGRPVLPTVLILEWLAHGALHQNAGLLFHGCNDLRILHGVILDGDAAPMLRVDAGKAVKRDGFFVAAVELRGVREEGREVLHARAEIVLVNQLPAAPAAAAAPSCQPYARTPEEIYQDLLFHGPDLHGIEQIDGCGERGILARVRSAPSPAEWIHQPLRQRWLADPLALDCSFQMMVVWSQELHGAPSLPCYLARYRQYQRNFPPAGVRVVVRVTRDSDLHALADIDYLDEGGQLVARLEGYECVIDPALRRAFGRQPLAATAP